jgi:hypothetical protein
LRQEREGCGEKGRGRLADEKQPPAVEAVGRAAGPGSEDEYRRELREAEDAEQESGVRQPEDEDGAREVLEPRAARRERVADEVGGERAGANEPEGGARPDRPTSGTGLADRLRYARPALCSAA